MRSFQKFFFILFFFPVFVMAEIKSSYNYYPFLAQGFNIDNYQKCMHLIRQCSSNDYFSCTKQTMHANKECQQLEKLSQILPFAPTAKQYNGLTVLDLLYKGDGQHEYYIVSKGSLIETGIDPRKLSKTLAEKYKKNSFLITNWSKPNYRLNSDRTQTITVVLRINKDCLACSIFGWATEEFNFTKDDIFLGVTLKDFKLGSNLSK